jgi:hypothetical protein
MPEEFSENQKSAGVPEQVDKAVVEQAHVPTKLADGTILKKNKKNEVEPAIDKRIDQGHLLEFLMESVQNSVDARQEWQSNLEQWYHQYKGVVEPKNFPWDNCSNLHIPISAIIVDTLTARMINPIFGIQPFVTARGTSEYHPVVPESNGGNDAPRTKPPESDHEKAHDVEAMLDFVLTKRVNIYPIVEAWIRESFIYGRGMIKILWRKDVRKYTRKLNMEQVKTEVALFQKKVEDGVAGVDTLEYLDQMTFILQNNDWPKKPFVKIEREEVVYNNPDWVFIPVEDFIYHPRAISIEKSPFCGHRFRDDYDNLLKMWDEGVYDNVDQINTSISDSDTDGMSAHGESLLKDVQTLEEGYGAETIASNDNLQEIELVEFHGKYDIDGDGRMEDIVATFSAKHRVLLAARETDLLHGKKPFAEIKMFPIPGRFESQGVCEIIKHLQQELNDIHNMRIDNGTITNAAMFWYDPNSDIDPEIHRPGPGVGFPAGANQIGILQTGDVKFSSFREEELVRRLIQDRIGVSDFAIGNDVTAGQNKTATGVNAIVNEGNQRMEVMLRNVALGLNEAVLQTFQLLQQFGDDDMYFRVVEGAESSMKKVTAKEIQGQYDIDLAANSVSTNRLTMLNEIQQQLELALRAGPSFVNVAPLIKDFMRRSGSRMADEVAVPVMEAVLREAQANPEILQQLYQEVTKMAEQAGIVPPPMPEGIPGAPPGAGPQGPPLPPGAGPPPAGGGGIDLASILGQLGPVIQGLLGGGGTPPAAGPPQGGIPLR